MLSRGKSWKYVSIRTNAVTLAGHVTSTQQWSSQRGYRSEVRLLLDMFK